MKKTALFVAIAVLALSFFSAQAQTRKKKSGFESSKKTTEREDSLERALDLYFDQYSSTYSLYQQKALEVAQKDQTNFSLRTQLAESEAESLKRKSLYDSLRFAQQLTVVGKKKKFAPPLDLGLPLTDYSGCKSDSLCEESLLDFLIKMPEQDFTSGDTKSRKMMYSANEAINRLDARTTANFFSIYASDMQSMPKDELRKKRPAYDFIMPRLIKRKQYILTHWEEYAEYKKDLIQMFMLPPTLKDKYILGWY